MGSPPGFLHRSRQHLADTELSYLGHMRVALGIGGRLFFAGIACILHGFLPGSFTNTASTVVRRIHAGLPAAPAASDVTAHLPGNLGNAARET